MDPDTLSEKLKFFADQFTVRAPEDEAVPREFYDYAVQKLDLNMEVVDRSLDEVKVRKYIEQLQPDEQKFVRELLDKTTYISFAELKIALSYAFEKFKKSIGDQPFYLMASGYKFGSEHWFIGLLWDQIRTMNLLGILNENSELKLTEPTNIVIIDDAIYTGNNVLSMIDEFSYFLSEKQGRPQKDICSNIKLHMVIPFINYSGLESINHFLKEFGIIGYTYSNNIIDGLSDLIDVSDNMVDRFGIDIPEMSAIYFDHKVAGSMSTFSMIYLDGLVPGKERFGSLFKVNPSRHKIEELETLYNQWKQSTKT